MWCLNIASKCQVWVTAEGRLESCTDMRSTGASPRWRKLARKMAWGTWKKGSCWSLEELSTARTRRHCVSWQRRSDKGGQGKWRKTRGMGSAGCCRQGLSPLLNLSPAWRHSFEFLASWAQLCNDLLMGFPILIPVSCLLSWNTASMQPHGKETVAFKSRGCSCLCWILCSRFKNFLRTS